MKRSVLFSLLVALGAMACSPSPATDAAADVQGDGAIDALLDASNDSPTDIAPDAADALDAIDAVTADALDVPSDGHVSDPMCPAALIDLNAVGTPVGAGIDYVGTNEGTPVASTVQRPWVIDPTHVVVLRYTPSMSGTYLLTLANPGTSPRFDAMLWVLDRCSVDQSRLRGWSTGSAATVPVRGVVAGTPFDIAVGAYSHYVDDVATAPFELRVVPLPTIALGSTCDRHYWNDACEEGTACVDDGSGPRCVARTDAGASCSTSYNNCPEDAVCYVSGSGHCVVPGQDGGTCLESAAPCADGLACFSGNICRPASLATGSCTPPSGSTCLRDESCSSSGMCVARGSLDTPCRTSGEPCDTGLACGGLTCRTAVAIGANCDIRGIDNACVAGSDCIGSSGASVCVAFGGAEARCRDAEPFCDAGLSCENGRCRTTAALGAPCGSTTSCENGSTCVSNGSTSTCVANGANGTKCRVDPPFCDDGFACGGFSTWRCRPLVMEGGSCDPNHLLDACAPGLSCQANVCVRVGP